jgi:hypothetical protein
MAKLENHCFVPGPLNLEFARGDILNKEDLKTVPLQSSE